jgi:N-acetylmuramoyl-L-alanine amidase
VRRAVHLFTAVLAVCLPDVVAAPVAGAVLRRARPCAAGGHAAETGGGGVTLRLGLSQPVPFRVFALADPRRVVVDFREVLWDGLPPGFADAPGITSVDVGAAFEPGWSRMVLSLDAPMMPRIAAMETTRRGHGGMPRLS